VLAYHGVPEPSVLRAQLERLVQRATPVSLASVERAIADGRPLPPGSVLVTFDDPDRKVLTHALPELVARRVPATAFVIAELVGTEQPFWWQEAAFLSRHGGRARSLPTDRPAELLARLRALPDPDRRRSLQELRVSAKRRHPGQDQLGPDDLRRLRGANISIGNHTLGHPCLSRCDDATVHSEVVGAHLALTRWLGEEPSVFAYPDGGFDQRAEAALRQLGYRLGFLSDHQLGPCLPGHPLRISRYQVDPGTSLRRFDAILAGRAA
jgi:peptidoglycan/xylan/chitin deacetylase (PgdA/CDA1 family)